MSDPQGLAFDALAEDYDRGRAGWPASVADGVDGNVVLDLGAGTGKLTTVLVERYDEVIAVEPTAGMRGILERNVPQATVLAGSAERIPLDDASVDAAFVFDAFHWFDSATAARELARAMRSGAALVVGFNAWRRGFRPGLTNAGHALLDGVYERLPTPGGPKVQSGAWKDGFADAPFSEFEEQLIDFDWTFDREGVASYYVSTSSMGALPEGERRELKDRLCEHLPDGAHVLALTAEVYRARRA
jgi:SAM-dependent methyltransferase